MSITFISGTDTDVGKTVATAALAAKLLAAGAAVAVYKPTQTGVSGGERGDVDEVARLSGVRSVHEGIRLKAPMAPRAAAALEHRELPSLAYHLTRVRELAATHDHVLVEGAGGVLVELDPCGNTIIDLAAALPGTARSGFVVVCRSALGTLNHTALTLAALRQRGFAAPAVLIGAWPGTPSIIEESNLTELQHLGADFLGALPAAASQLEPAAFRSRAAGEVTLPAWV